MGTARGSGDAGWLNWLSRGDKRRQGVLSSQGPARTGYGALASKILDGASEQATTLVRAGVTPAPKKALEIEIGRIEPGMASSDPPSRSVSSESIAPRLATSAPDGDLPVAAHSLEPAALDSVAEASGEAGPASTVLGLEPPDIADTHGEPLASEPHVAPVAEDRLEFANPADARSALIAELAEEAAYTLVFTANSVPYSVGKGMEHTLITDGSGITALRIAKGEEKANSTGNTGGYSVRVPDEFEKLASGRMIKLRLLARSLDAANGRIACAYSTNEVGNSGWRWLSFGPEWEIKSFEFNVPPMKEGRGDFVGLLPPAAGAPETEVLGFAIQVAT